MSDPSDGACRGGSHSSACQGGRSIYRDGDPFWSTPCHLEGTDEFVMVNDDDPADRHHIHIKMCRAHLLAIESDLEPHQ